MNNGNVGKTYQPWINIARAIGIILVVLGHSVSENTSPLLVRTIYSFHMPLFFMLSGILYKKTALILLIKRKAINLLIPYAFFYLLTLGWFYFVEARFRPGIALNGICRLIPLFYGTNIANLMSHNIVLWFLPTLFSTEILYALIDRYIKSIGCRVLVLCGMVLLGTSLYNVGINWLPLGLNVAMIAVGFYGIGVYLRALFFKGLSKTSICCAILFCFCLYAILGHAVGLIRFDMQSGIYGGCWGTPLFYCYAVLGSCCILFISYLIAGYKYLELLGRSGVTLAIMALHGSICRIVKFGYIKYFSNNGGGILYAL